MNRDHWLEERRKGIGGSDVAAILGISQWDGPYSVWADKLGLLPPKEDNEAMRQGRDLEEYVAKRFCEATGKKVRRVNRIIYSQDYPFMLANIDRDVVGENSGLECKTTSVMNLKKLRGVEFPEQYYCQCVHYLAVTGYQRWYLAVLVLNAGFYIYQVTRIEDDEVPDWCSGSIYIDQSEIDTLIQAEQGFWSLVVNKTPPPVDGLDATRRALELVNPSDPDAASVILYGKEDLIEELNELKEIDKKTTSRTKEIKNLLLADLGSSVRGVLRGYEIIRQTIKRGEYTVQASEYTTLKIKERIEQ